MAKTVHDFLEANATEIDDQDVILVEQVEGPRPRKLTFVELAKRLFTPIFDMILGQAGYVEGRHISYANTVIYRQIHSGSTSRSSISAATVQRAGQQYSWTNDSDEDLIAIITGTAMFQKTGTGTAGRMYLLNGDTVISSSMYTNDNSIWTTQSRTAKLKIPAGGSMSIGFGAKVDSVVSGVAVSVTNGTNDTSTEYGGTRAPGYDSMYAPEIFVQFFKDDEA